MSEWEKRGKVKGRKNIQIKHSHWSDERAEINRKST
jgi:hypothetical protein